MKDGDVVYAKSPPEWQPETRDPSKGTVIWKLQKKVSGAHRDAGRTIWQPILGKCGFVPNMLDTCWWSRTTTRVSPVFHLDDLLLAGAHQIITKVLTEFSRDLGS